MNPSATPRPMVVIPTVPRRRAPLMVTLAQWRRAGFAPVIRVQPEDAPLGHDSQRANAEALLRYTLGAHPEATHIVFSEDDVDLAPDLAERLPHLCDDRVVSLFVTGLAHYPPWIGEVLRAGEELPTRSVERVRSIRVWYGTQGIVLPRRVVEAVLAFPGGRSGWDAHLQDWLVATGTPLWVVVPNLVQHRRVPSCVEARGGRFASATFGWPVQGESVLA